MRKNVTADFRFFETLNASRSHNDRVAVLLPTISTLLGSKDYRSADLILGDVTKHHQVSVHDGMRAIAQSPPSLVIIHSDQFVAPSVANVLVLLDEYEAYISSIEYLLNSKYGYTLIVWLGDEWETIAPGEKVQHVARLVVAYLRACSKLGDRWLLSSAQRYRMRHIREAIRERRLRFVRSSIAYAYAEAPSSDVINALYTDLSDIEAESKAGVPQ